MPSIELSKRLGLTLVGDKPADENKPDAPSTPARAPSTPPRITTPRPPPPPPPPRTYRQLRPRRRS